MASSSAFSLLSIGEQLRGARMSRGITIAGVAHTLLIPAKYLRELEANRWRSIPESLYRELFLKTYATYLGLCWEAVKEQYSAECRLFDETPFVERLHVSRALCKTSLIVAPQFIKTVCFGLVISAGFVYLLFLGYRATMPPSLTVMTPIQDAVVTTDRIVVSGYTSPTSHVTINGESIMLSQDGNFEQSIILTDGMNLIRVGAAKKYSKEQSVERRVLYRHETARGDKPQRGAF